MNHMKQRRGYTLYQLLIVMSVGATLLVLNVAWIHESFNFASVMNQRQKNHSNLTRLAWELRDDVRASHSLSMDGEDGLVLSRDDGQQTSYMISAASVVVEKRSNEISIGREIFKLSPNLTARWDTSEMPGWISLIVARGREGANTKSDENSEPQSAAEELPPVDLHVRVGPHRWPLVIENVVASESGTEQKQ